MRLENKLKHPDHSCPAVPCGPAGRLPDCQER